MFDINHVYSWLGVATPPEAPHEFGIDGLGSLVFDEDGVTAHVVMAYQAEPLEILSAVRQQPQEDLGMYLSCSPGGRICYHVTTTDSRDQTTELLQTLDRLIGWIGKD